MDGYLGTPSCVHSCVSVYLSVCFTSRDMHLNAALREWKDGWQVVGNVFWGERRDCVKRAKCLSRSVLSQNELLVNIYHVEQKLDIANKPKS